MYLLYHTEIISEQNASKIVKKISTDGEVVKYNKKLSYCCDNRSYCVQECMPTRNTLVQLLALYTNPESHNAQRHRQTDGRQDDANSRSHCVAVRSAKKLVYRY